MYRQLLLVLLLASSQLACGQKRIVLTNDDGWATAIIRAQNDALKQSGFDVVLSAPAINQSGTGSSSAEPTVLETPCEFDTCPAGSPPEGSDPADPRLNYVNAFPVDAVRFGIQTLAPKFFDGAPPDFVVSGSNVGSNLGPGITGSGTVGAACEAALEGIPSTAFSGFTGSQVSFTTLTTDPTSDSTRAALAYADATVRFVQTLTQAGPKPILPPGITLNVNYPPITHCSSADNFKFVLTRLAINLGAQDTVSCGINHLPDETSVIVADVLLGQCFATVSVINATTKADVDAATQKIVQDRLGGLLTCLITL